MFTTTLSLTFLLLPTTAQGQDLATLEMKEVRVPLPSGDSATAYRGMLRVPIVRADPDSKEIGVDVWRFPAAEGVQAGRPPVFRLNGGPGWSGWNAQDIDWQEDIAPWVAHGDLVVVGQRGIGTSEPNTSCGAFSERVDPDLSREEQNAAVLAQCAACREHWESEGYDLRGFNVLEAAADVNDARRLLGYDQIALIGGSFGSHWGMTVMRTFPDIVQRAVLHGMEGPDHTYDSPSGVLGALEQIAAQAEASGQFGERLPEEGLIEALRYVIESIDADPFEFELGGEMVPITGDGLRELALGYTSRVNSRGSVGGWPADVMRLYEGEFELAARAIAARRGGGGGLPTASFFSLDCGSGITAARLERYRADPAVAIVGDLSRFYEAACPAWDSDLGDEFRADFKTSIPTVIVHGTWDVSTPFVNALELLPCFEELHFIPVDGGTHGALREAIRDDPAFGDALMAFVFEGEAGGLPESVELPPIEWQTSW